MRWPTAACRVVTLVSDVPSSRRAHYVGIDNSAAGRTAATLMGRYLCGRKGKVGLIAGSLSLRDHVERQFGFEQVMASDFRQSRAACPCARAATTANKAQTVAEQLLADHPDMIGLYNVGAGSGGIAAALEAGGRQRHSGVHHP